MYKKKSKTKLQKYGKLETWQQRLIGDKLEIKTPINMDLKKKIPSTQVGSRDGIKMTEKRNIGTQPKPK